MNKIIAKQLVDAALDGGGADELFEVISTLNQLKNRNSGQAPDNLFSRYKMMPLNQLVTVTLTMLAQSGNRVAHAALKINQTSVKIEKIITEIEKVWRQRIEYAQLESARALNSNQLADLTAKLKQSTSRVLIVRQKVNSDLIGGLILRFRGLTYRFDLNSQIMALKHG